MKNIGIIYLIFMVLLSALPCNDEIENQDAAFSHISKIEQKKSQEAESCSPICLCSCCGQSVVEPQLVVFELKIPTVELEKELAQHQFSLLQQAYHIWQPPKLAVNG
ncbi:hypothetical protein EZ428_19890 [Pedobacter frigiditerrae]|uniref:Uncharacterized protein n=1 Tax=Pedobacter frigiditerrae TaxID=2530452 RepID=A0A4R0MMM4_9SPHI|nr:DUF6660 family protein [Pedobacter frigiditerrae]TCC87991.1 hypothetical protein EZ428_19890 [Pedobacter frigiditerrae]